MLAAAWGLAVTALSGNTAGWVRECTPGSGSASAVCTSVEAKGAWLSSGGSHEAGLADERVLPI